MATLRELRELAILTQAELAQKIGVSTTSISHWETGSKRPRPTHIRKLAAALGVTAQEILAAIKETMTTRK
jgi:transcriptional regulator with XRE-family HTH domain